MKLSRPLTVAPRRRARVAIFFAADPETAIEVLWRIARDEPELRRWLVINPKADASLLEYVSQAGGPGVKQALNVLFDSLDALESERAGPVVSKPAVAGVAA